MSKYKKIANLLENMKIPKNAWESNPYYKEYTEMLPISFLENFRGNAPTRLSPTEMEKLKESISNEGLRESLPFSYDPTNGNLLLGEGNHRLRALKELGYTEAPTRMIRSRLGDSGISNKVVRIPEGHPPADAKPSQILDLEQILQNYRKSKE